MNSSQTEINELKDYFLSGFKKLSLSFRQRRQILDNPESVLVPDSARFPNGPLAFALIALSASYLLMAPISFVASNFVGLPPSALDNLIARLKSGNLAPESDRFSVDFLEHLAKEGTFVRNFRLAIAAISVYFAASLFQWFLRKLIYEFPKVRHAQKAFIYIVAAHWFWANLAMGMSYFIIDWWSRFSGADYELVSTVQGWTEFTILLWMLLILYRAATPLRSSLEFPSNMKTFTFNRMLISLLLVNIALFVAIGAAVRFLKWQSGSSPVSSAPS